MIADQRFDNDVDRLARVMLKLGVMPEPPVEEPVRGRAYPLAVDVHGRIGAVSFAVFGLDPDVEPGWWCLARHYVLRDGGWQDAGGEHAAVTAPDPFEAPASADRSESSWIDWTSAGGHGEWDDEPRTRHLLFGIASAATARLTVTDEGGQERPLAITPWCGAYVAAVAGRTSRLTGYATGGEELGSIACGDGAGDDAAA